MAEHALNEAQADAASHKDGPLLIVAGAGAGKTKTIAHRILNLVQTGVTGDQILAITFTNKAAKEMRDRVLHLLQTHKVGVVRDPERPWAIQTPASGTPFVSTFHSLGVYILKEQAAKLGLTRYFTIYDSDDSLSAIKRALKSLGYDPKQYEPKRIQNAISREKNNLVDRDTYASLRGHEYWGNIVSRVWEVYETTLGKEKALDFDDLIGKVVWLFTKYPEIKKHYQQRWRYIHIDEYQDTNVAQYELSRLLADGHRNICVVGDTDQAIYAWRGADYRNILNFEEEYTDAKVVLLEQNYRSTQVILEAANTVICKNKFRKEKKLFTQNDGGELISVFQATHGGEEAGWVAKKAEKLIKSGVNPSSIAVLYRANFVSRLFEEAFLVAGVPYHLLGTAFYDRKEVKDTLAYIRLALNPDDAASLSRIINIPARGIGEATLAKVLGGKEEELPSATRDKLAHFRKILSEIKEVCLRELPSNAVRFAIKRSGIEAMYADGKDESEERLENVRELATLATRYDALGAGAGIEEFLSDTALLSDQDALMQKKDGVRLMTVHAAKGLEFDYVFVVGLEQDLFPHRHMGDDASEEHDEEERRLFYVAVTRARKKLFLTYATVRTIFGSQKINAASEFLGDIDETLTEQEVSGNAYFEPYSDNEPVIEWESLRRQ